MTDTTTKAEEAAAIRAAPVLSFDLGAEAAALREGEAWRASGHSAKTLVKHEDMRVVLIVLKAGEGLHEHATDHRITVQALSGRLPRLLRDPDPARAKRAMDAMMGMRKLDIAALERAQAGNQ